MMKKLLIGAAVIFFVQACHNNPGESGVVNDGIKAVDKNGGLQDTAPFVPNPSIDTAKGENRVDIQQRNP